MNDSDRHDQIEALAELKRLLDDEEGADADDIRDAAIRVVNRFGRSIAVHDYWHAYSRRGSSDPGTRAEAAQLGSAGVELHPEYRGRLRRRIGSSIAYIAINEKGSQDGDSTAGDYLHHELRHGTTRWEVNLLHNGEWARCSTTRGSLADAEMAGARELAALKPPRRARR